MGLNLIGSSCSCGNNNNYPYYSEVPVTPNPDPKRYKILRTHVVGEYVIAEIRYIGCTNYEGRKILLFRGHSLKTIVNAERLDPHFCDSDCCISPIARFEPNTIGWEMAKKLASSS